MDPSIIEASNKKDSSCTKYMETRVNLENLNLEGDACNLKQCSDVLDEICEKSKVENDPLEEKEDALGSHSGHSSSTEDYADAEDMTADEEIEMDDETLKENQKCWTEEDVQENKEVAQSLKNDGNVHFKSGQYSEAVKLYSRAINTCPLQCSEERSVLYSNRAAAKIYLDLKEEAVLDCNKAIDLNPDYLKALHRRAELHRKMENLDQSLNDYKRVLELDPDSREARQACMTLPQEIAERNEKLKTEMMGKLKDLGNLVLRPFGLSTDNFNLVKDNSTGSYSVNFQNKR